MRPYYIAAAFVILLFLPGVKAIDPPDISIIPSNISWNSSFLMVADTFSAQSTIAKVSWVMYGTPEYGGLEFNRGTTWAYYSTDNTIFPSPSYGTPYTLEVTTKSITGETANNSIGVNVGGIPIKSNIYVVGNNVNVSAWAYRQNDVNSISYTVYFADTLEALKSGQLKFSPQTGIFNTNLNNLTSGDYYISFSTATATDFGGSLEKFTVGSGGPGQGVEGVYVEPIVYRPVVSAGNPFTLKKFKITNTGTENLTGLTISVPPEILSACNCQLSIEPESTSLAPNQSTLMTVSLTGMQSSMNISIFATLLSGSDELYQIPVNLDVSMIAGSCSGKQDGTDCLGGICCSNQCQKKANCCIDYDCASGQTCSKTTFQCTTPAVTNECDGKNDMDTCTGGICCSNSCISGGTCCSDIACSGTDVCVSNKCGSQTTPSGGCTSSSECPGSEVCDNGTCVTSSTNGCDPPCTGDQECVDSSCITPTNPSGGMDLTTIALIGGGIAAAAVVGFIVFKKFVKKKGSGDEEELGGSDKEDGEEEFSDEDFY